jgi:hypothetical protein
MTRGMFRESIIKLCILVILLVVLNLAARWLVSVRLDVLRGQTISGVGVEALPLQTALGQLKETLQGALEKANAVQIQDSVSVHLPCPRLEDALSGEPLFGPLLSSLAVNAACQLRCDTTCDVVGAVVKTGCDLCKKGCIPYLPCVCDYACNWRNYVQKYGVGGACAVFKNVCEFP